ncbi:MAG: DUF6970 domain-containing protein [Flavobacteriaceae bacterium]
MRRYALVFIVLLSTCSKTSLETAIPDCIQQKINTLEKENARNPPAKVYQYTYQNQTVYYIPSYCCDLYSELYDSNCTLICHPDGGITGRGDGRCTDFFDLRKDEKLIWEDLRKE